MAEFDVLAGTYYSLHSLKNSEKEGTSMLDARLDDVLSRIDTITNRLAASNSGKGERLSSEQEMTLVYELHHLNVRVAARFAAYADLEKRSRPPSRSSQLLGGLAAAALLAGSLAVIMVLFMALMGNLAVSLASMAHPVP